MLLLHRGISVVVDVQLAGDLGFGIPWLLMVLTVSILLAAGFFTYIILSTRSKHALLAGFDKAKYELNKYHAERYWAIFIGGLLFWFWFLGYPWMPPVASHDAIENPDEVHLIKVTAGQWFWQLEDGGYMKNASSSSGSTQGFTNEQADSSQNPLPESRPTAQVNVKAGETVKFIATSRDVNHGFSILSSSKSMDSPLMQMQVVPGFNNEFYFTFQKPGVYTIRCLEYCGWNHPYMISQITINAA
jgi:heme/copper-type cytochrome/quinol oxidase subunit 2